MKERIQFSSRSSAGAPFSVGLGISSKFFLSPQCRRKQQRNFPPERCLKVIARSYVLVNPTLVCRVTVEKYALSLHTHPWLVWKSHREIAARLSGCVVQPSFFDLLCSNTVPQDGLVHDVIYLNNRTRWVMTCTRNVIFLVIGYKTLQLLPYLPV